MHDTAECRASLGLLVLLEGHHADAEGLLQDALAVQRQLNDANCSAISLGYLGLLSLEQGDPVSSQDRLEQSISLMNSIDNQVGIASALVMLGTAYFAGGNVEKAEAAYRERLGMKPAFGNLEQTAFGLEGVAELALARGHPERTVRLLGAAYQALRSVGAAPLPLPPLGRTVASHHSCPAGAWRNRMGGGLRSGCSSFAG